jgi:hypothetical protein
MIELLGWISTLIVLIGFILNARRNAYWAMIFWIIGDIGWIVYDIFIMNFSHLVLSLVIISINGYGVFNLLSHNGKLGNKI